MRLTKKDEIFLGGYEPRCDFYEAFSKLGHWEDVEELCERLATQGYYYARRYGFISRESHERFLGSLSVLYDFKERQIVFLFAGAWLDSLSVSEYGKTWALTKEELS